MLEGVRHAVFAGRIVDRPDVDGQHDARDAGGFVPLDHDPEAARQRVLPDREQARGRRRRRSSPQVTAASAAQREDEAPAAPPSPARDRAYLIESSSMSNTSIPLGAPGRGELS